MTYEVVSPLVYWSAIHPVPLTVVMFDRSPNPPFTEIDHNLAFRVKTQTLTCQRAQRPRPR